MLIAPFNDLAAVEGLALARDGARFHQVDDAVGHHLGVDAEVLLVFEKREQRMGNAPNADFDRRAILDKRGNVQADDKSYRTSSEKVYVAGDMRRGQSLVVWAIREGRQAARSIDQALMGATTLPL